MLTRIALLFLLAAAIPSAWADPLTDRAEALEKEGSFALAHEAWKAVKAGRSDLDPDDTRRVAIHLADTLWRSRASVPNDPALETAREELEKLASAEPPDAISAQASVALGDFWWTRRNQADWGNAWPYYDAALKFWAASSDIEAARTAYLGIVDRIVDQTPTGRYNPQVVPIEVLASAAKIAVLPADVGWTNTIYAARLVQQGDAVSRIAALRVFETALKAGTANPRRAELLDSYARWLAQPVVMVPLAGGGFSYQPDLPRALEIYRLLLSEFPPGRSPYSEAAKAAIAEITQPAVTLQVSQNFLPGSKPSVILLTRNVGKVQLTLTRIDLPTATSFEDGPDRGRAWQTGISTKSGEQIASWSVETEEKGDHVNRTKDLRLEQVEKPGAYLLEASAGGKTSREVVLVTDASLTVHGGERSQIAWFCNAANGKPIPDARVVRWNGAYDGKGGLRWTREEQKTDADGLARFSTLPQTGNQFFSAVHDDRQAFLQVNGGFARQQNREWRIYTTCDRAAYRPGETVHWKMIARIAEGSEVSTPADKKVGYAIVNPRGERVATGDLQLNAFGSAWADLALSADMPLGEYRIDFYGIDNPQGSVLFRLEEYRLPEFKVSVDLPKTDGKAKAYLLGDSIEATIAADFYSGGGVPGAEIEVLVRATPWQFSPPIPYPVPRLAMGMRGSRPVARDFGNAQIILQEKLRSGPDGRATVRFLSAIDSPTDLQYEIEARVVDSTRREIIGTATVRVARQSVFATLEPSRTIVRPADKDPIVIRTENANGDPIPAAGDLVVWRDRFEEVWISPDGKEVRGEDLLRIQEATPIFPPPPVGDAPGWRLKSRTTESKEITRVPFATPTEGRAEWKFEPETTGTYRITWSSQGAGSLPATASANVWVTDGRSALGYRSAGIEIIADPSRFVVGQTAPVLISTNLPFRHVMFTAEADGVTFDARVVSVGGDPRQLDLQITEAYAPNVFLTAVMPSNYQLQQVTRELAVSDSRHELQVKIDPPESQHLPGSDGSVKVFVTDADGKPVSAELSVAVTDQSLDYIQKRTGSGAGEFFFGRPRQQEARVQSSLMARSFRLVEPTEQEAFSDSDLGSGRRLFALGTDARMRGAVASTMSATDGFINYGSPIPQTATIAGMAAAAEISDRRDSDFIQKSKSSADADGEPEAGPVAIRSDFRSTAFWNPSVLTDEKGEATVAFKFPENLTSWQIVGQGATTGTRFGEGTAVSVTQKPLIARLQAPRFLVRGDSAVLAGVVNNHTDKPLTVRCVLKRNGKEQEPRTLTVPANGESRAEWTVRAAELGTDIFTFAASGGKLSDGTERRVPVFEYGAPRFIARAGKTAESVQVDVSLPKDRGKGSEKLLVSVTPSVAIAALDAIPYLVRYPYGCVEQTMSRFLPAVIASRTLTGLGWKPESVAGRVFGGIDPAFALKTHPDPAVPLAEMDNVTRSGIRRLADMQHGDGGWGWWKGDETDLFMTGYVMWGLRLAVEAKVELPNGMIERGRRFLLENIGATSDRPDLQAWLLQALGPVSGEPLHQAALGQCWNSRESLTAYGRALLALALKDAGDMDRARVLVRNLQDNVLRDAQPGVSAISSTPAAPNPDALATAHWGSTGAFLRWQEGGVETTSFVLRALVAIDPTNALIEPVVQWLVTNRRGAQWSSTRDTAIVVLAFCDYLKATGEAEAETSFVLSVNGREIAKETAAAAKGRSVFEVDPAVLQTGANAVEVRRLSGSPLFYSVEASYFSQENPIPSAGNVVFVERTYQRYVGRETLLDGYVFDRKPWRSGESVPGGERFDVLLTIEAKNDLEYLLFEDFRPAGMESVALRSGEWVEALHRDTGETRRVYCELRDRFAAFFPRQLPAGIWEIRYDLRAETPGSFRALPATGHAMYVPEIRANSASAVFEITP